MPLNIDFVQILLHILNFVILAGGLTLLLYKPISKFLNERREYFEQLEADNAQAAQENQKLKEEYEKKLADANTEIAQLRQDAERDAADAAKAYLESAKQKADNMLSAAETDAEARKHQILESAQTEIGELVLEATQKLVANSGDAERTRALYDEFIEVAQNESGADGETDA